MADAKERRRTPRKATPKPDSKAAAPQAATDMHAHASPGETKRRIAEAAYYRAKQRGFQPGRELEDWVEAESEIMGRINGPSD